MHTTIIRLVWSGGALALLLALGAALGTAGATPTVLPFAGPPQQVLMHLGCRNCVSFGIGNATPVAVHNGDPATQCSNCRLTTSQVQYFWASISGPGSQYDDGDPYNTKYLFSGGWNGLCPGQINIGPLNSNYIPGPNSQSGGYSYGLSVDGNNPTPLTVYVYDPAQYYRPLNGGNTDPDTLDSQACYSNDPTRYRYRTYYTLYAPDNTPDYFYDDVQIFQTSFIDTGDPALHNHWFPLTTLDPALIGANMGDFRLQVTTDDYLANWQYGVGSNQYSLALGGARVPQNAETIYNFARSSVLNNIRAVPGNGVVDYDITQVPMAYAGGQMIIRGFDLGDLNCNSRLRLLNPDGQIAMFKHNNITDTTFIDTTICSPSCLRPYNGLWTSMLVELPADYQGGWWQIRYEVGTCRTSTTTADRTVWEVLVRRPAATTTPTATPTLTAPSPSATAIATGTPPGTTPSPSSTPPTATATPCLLTFTDVDLSNPFYPFVRCLACRGILSGYADGTFRPTSLVTRAQVCKLITLAAGLNTPIPSGQQSFEDVLPSHPFWLYIERLANAGYISGYPGGGPGEPCPPPGNRPWFRPYANITRRQLAKIDANSAQYSDVIPSDQQTFEDVPSSNPFWLYIERVNLHGVISGYGCGGPGEPCVPPMDRPYFRTTNSATRGQTAKIVANTFYPACQTPQR